MRVGEKQLFYFFERWNRALEKNECAVCAVGFFSSNFDVFPHFPHCAQRVCMWFVAWLGN
ncbi:hypothetical protein DFQ08_1103 [Winogradskyella arenosi]|uniref:Uncharacterized protein n=1 Tax=Winogradskyella arenosi TaxID=533325 RepID=A0A368ZD62_9FLAO|nr:hypothetical protein DFQ08_1103 [Winogradskyella arenosi]